MARNTGPRAADAAHWPPETPQTGGIDVIALFKAVPLGLFLTAIVCLFIGSGGSSGGFLAIRNMDVDLAFIGVSFDMYWSWIMFAIGTGLAWAIIFMMGD